MVFRDEEKYKDNIGIYQIVNLVNGKVYIGQTIERFQRRYWHHNWCLNSNKHFNKYLQNAWNKYGKDAFEFRVVHTLQPNEDINEFEKYYIEQFNATNQQYGYNLQDGGQPEQLCRFTTPESRKLVGEKNRQHMLGRKLSEETKAKMRASSRHQGPGEKGRQKISQYMSNRIVSDETRQKLREANTGSNSPVTKLNEDKVDQIKQSIINGEIQRLIAERYDVSLGAISAIANNRTWTHVNTPGWNEYIKNKNTKKRNNPVPS